MKVIRKDSQETRQRLIDAAEKLFAEQGIENVKLVDVSRESGQKNRNAAQYHFGDRLGLFNAVLDRHSQYISAQRNKMLARLDQGGDFSMTDLVEVLVRPVVNYAHTNQGGVIYLMLNRQIVSNSHYMKMSWQRVSDLAEVIQLQQLMKIKMAPHSKAAMRTKMMLVQCMLFNGLANHYDLYGGRNRKVFVDVLCASIGAVLLEGKE